MRTALLTILKLTEIPIGTTVPSVDSPLLHEQSSMVLVPVHPFGHLCLQQRSKTDDGVHNNLVGADMAAVEFHSRSLRPGKYLSI